VCIDGGVDGGPDGSTDAAAVTDAAPPLDVGPSLDTGVAISDADLSEGPMADALSSDLDPASDVTIDLDAGPTDTAVPEDALAADADAQGQIRTTSNKACSCQTVADARSSAPIGGWGVLALLALRRRPAIKVDRKRVGEIR
jgi:hypothetical protein